jgi:hypothetical protein
MQIYTKFLKRFMPYFLRSILLKGVAGGSFKQDWEHYPMLYPYFYYLCKP